MSVSYGTAVVLRVITIGLSSLGYTIQRKAYLINSTLPEVDQRHSFRMPLWHLGFWTYIIFSVVGDIFSISNLPILVVAPLGTFMLLFNALYAHIILSERMKRLGILGTLLIALASVGIAILLNVEQTQKDSKELLKLLLKPAHITFASFSLFALFAITSLGIFYIRRLSKLKKVLRQQQLIVLDSELPQSLSQLISTNAQKDVFGFRIALSFAVASSISAVQALIFTKICFDLLHLSFSEDTNQFKDPVSIVVATVAIVMTVLQLYLFNLSLKFYTTTITIPIGYSLGIILACVNTLIYFDSFSFLETWKIVLVVVCLLVCIFGIALLCEQNEERWKQHVSMYKKIPFLL